MLINFLLFVTTLFLFCGLALDVGIVQLRKLQLQHAADAAALGASVEKARGQSDWVTAGKADAGLNGFTDGSNGVSISIVSPPTSGSYSGDTSAIQAVVTQNVHTAFLGMFGAHGTATPGARSVAKSSANPDCVYILGAGSLLHPLMIQNFSGFYSACNIYIDSTTNTLENDLGSTLSVTGGNSIKIQGSSSTALLWGTTSPSPTFDSTNENDPLAYETAPTFSSCTYSNTYVLLTTTTLNPGTYCNLTITSSTVTFNPGLYILVGGSTWQGGSTINGTGVTFYLTKGTGGWNYYSNFNIFSSTVTLSAPTSTASGGITGVVFFADRNWVDSGGQNLFVESSYVTTDGIWYAPNVGIWNFASTIKGTNYLGIITDNMYLSAATITVPSPNYSSLSGGSPYASSGGAGIVE